jgi:hypothetical protein
MSPQPSRACKIAKEPKSTTHVASVASAAGFASIQAALSLHSPLPPNHPLYAQIGRVASEWAHIEHISLISLFGNWLTSTISKVLLHHITNPRCKPTL